MGIDKANLPFGNQTFLQRIYETCEAVCNEVRVAVGPGDAFDAFERLRLHGGATSDPGLGPLAAISERLSSLYSDALVFVTACDTPMLRAGIVQLLFDRAKGNRGAVPVVAGFPQATCAVYASEVAADTQALVNAGERRASSLASLPGIIAVGEDELRTVDPDLRSFRGCNTVEEYIELLDFAGKPVPYEFLEAAGVRVPGQS
jgi:molybdopterin-guanine dinucleotide biosynthesis protein A